MTTVTIFEQREVRHMWHNNQWYFVVDDVVRVLTESVDVSDYVKKMKLRDLELNKSWGEIIIPLSIKTKGGRQKLNCANLQGIFRIIQSIPSAKAEPFKVWLARVGQERIEEIQDPEKAMSRIKETYEQKGYPADWIAKRMRGMNVRHSLTDEWKNRGAVYSTNFAILTNEIYKGTFEITAKEMRDHKSLHKPDNLRDHMNELELILTMLGEATTTELTQVRDSKGLHPLMKDAKDGGQVAGNARKEIEVKSGKTILSKGVR